MSTSTDYEYKPQTGTGRIANFADTRLGLSPLVKEFGRKIFPDHWSFMLGEVALYTFIILLLSGTFLALWFEPSMAALEYEGSYVPMRGVEMSAAYASSLDISFDIRGGLFLRQIHHWSALVFAAAISVHMLRVFFTGAFRRPRELNWLIGVGLFLLAIVAGFSGYSLPDDVLSGNGLRIADAILKAIPIVGAYLSMFLFGGEFPGHDIIARLYIIHVLLIPAAILALIVVHLILVVVHKHTQYPGPGRTEHNVVGVPIGPIFAAKGGGFFCIVFGIMALMAATTTIRDLELRSLRSLPGPGRLAARLVHGLHRRRRASHARHLAVQLGVDVLGHVDPHERAPADDADHGAVRPHGRVAVDRALGDEGRPGAPHPGPSPQCAVPHGHGRRRRGVLHRHAGLRLR
jgi:ubiquinol-cytochrome c reductase cytochrome b subunit